MPLIFFDVAIINKPFDTLSDSRVTHFVLVHNVFVQNKAVIVKFEIIVNALSVKVVEFNQEKFPPFRKKFL